MTNSSNPVPSLLSFLPLLIRGNKGNHKIVVFSEPYQSLKLWSSYGTLTLAAITACPLLVEPAQAWDNNSTQHQSWEMTSSQPDIQPTVDYELKPGDTLWELAQTYQTSAEKIAQYNGIDAQTSLKTGTTITIPINQTGNTYQSQPLGSHNKNEPAGAGTLPLENLELSLTQPNQEVPETIPPVSSHGQESNQPKLHLFANQKLLQTKSESHSTLSSGIDSPEAATKEPSTLSNFKSEDQLHQEEFVARAPLEVNFSNPFDKPIGKPVSPELPPLASSDQYLPNGEQAVHNYIWPAEGIFTSGYGHRWGRRHEGIDIAASIGTPVVASNSGEVVFAGWKRGYGKSVKLRHSDDSLTLYAHNNQILVQPGEYVQQGEPIAKMGNTGRSTGPHLHFELHPAETQQPVDPLAYLPDGEKIQEGHKVYKLGRK